MLAPDGECDHSELDILDIERSMGFLYYADVVCLPRWGTWRKRRWRDRRPKARLGRGLELTPVSLPVSASASWEVLLPAVQDDEGVLSQPGGGILGRLAGDVEANACRMGRHVGIYESEGRSLFNGIDCPPLE